MVVFLLGCVTGGGGGDETECSNAPPLPRLTLSESEIDFGYVWLGESAEQTVELSNTGDEPLGVTSIAINDVDVPDFTVVIGEVACATLVDVEPLTDPPDSGSGWLVEDSGAAEVELVARVLEPGCVVPLTLTYTPTRSHGAQNVLLLKSEDWAGDLAFYPDPTHASRGVWLAGTTDVDPGAPEPLEFIVGDYIAWERTALHEGEHVQAEIRTTFEPGEGTVHWTTDAAGGHFEEITPLSILVTAPEIPGDFPNSGRYVSMYAVVTSDDGYQDWTFSELAVWDEHHALESCDDRVFTCVDTYGRPVACKAACSCGGATGSASGAALGLVLLAVVRRRRAFSPPMA